MMEENVRLELFTVQQVRQWLKTGKGERGLSDEVISRIRAWAIINGPYAQDDDPVVVAIFENDKIAAHVTTFPELINGERYWLFPDLWCASEHEGKGYSLIVIGTITEIFGADYCIDKWGAPEAVKIFEYLGNKTTYLPRYTLSANRKPAKGKLARMARFIKKNMQRVFERHLPNVDYSLRYLSFIDDETYSFIAAHSDGDYIIHTQDFFNWVLQFPFTISTPLYDRVVDIMPFAASETPNTQIFAVQVIHDGQIIGFYLMKRKESGLYILYMYYDMVYQENVFASIRDHIRHMRVSQCVTENKELIDYLREQLKFPILTKDEISFSYPEKLGKPLLGHVQYGDGDCFTV